MKIQNQNVRSPRHPCSAVVGVPLRVSLCAHAPTWPRRIIPDEQPQATGLPTQPGKGESRRAIGPRTAAPRWLQPVRGRFRLRPEHGSYGQTRNSDAPGMAPGMAPLWPWQPRGLWSAVWLWTAAQLWAAAKRLSPSSGPWTAGPTAAVEVADGVVEVTMARVRPP